VDLPKGYQYEKAGVMLSEISPVTHWQGDLLVEAEPTNPKLDAGAGHTEPTLWPRHGQDLNTRRLQGLGDATGAKVTKLHDLLG